MKGKRGTSWNNYDEARTAVRPTTEPRARRGDWGDWLTPFEPTPFSERTERAWRLHRAQLRSVGLLP